MRALVVLAGSTVIREPNLVSAIKQAVIMGIGSEAQRYILPHELRICRGDGSRFTEHRGTGTQGTT